MKNPTTFRELFNSVRDTIRYKVEGAIIEFTEQVSDRIASMQLSRTEFANKLNTSPAYVTKLLAGGTNFTLESMVKVADALDSEIQIQIVPKDSTTAWMRLMGGSDEARHFDYGLKNEWRRISRADAGGSLVGSQISCTDAEFDHMFLTS